MALELIGYVDLPPHDKPGGFDHAAVHLGSGRLYVAHTANDAVDVIDGTTRRYTGSIRGLAGVAGALVSEERGLVFTSNRAENTVGIFSAGDESSLIKVRVGLRPNGLAYDPGRHLVLAANVGDSSRVEAFTVSIVDVGTKTMIFDVPVAGRTRWTVFDARAGRFYVNIADPPQIAVIDAANPGQVAAVFPMPAAGPHGLDLDPASHRLFCACDGKVLLAVDAPSGKILASRQISGVPDVVFFNPRHRHLYVAVGDPGVIEVFDTDTMERLETVKTEKGAHTIGFDASGNVVYAFLPDTHRAAVYRDPGR